MIDYLGLDDSVFGRGFVAKVFIAEAGDFL
jgi:hypothetical protein